VAAAWVAWAAWITESDEPETLQSQLIQLRGAFPDGKAPFS